jgi:Na+/proline symporter
MLWFPLIIGVYWKKANTTGAVWGMGIGFVIAMIWLISSGTFYPEPEWLWTFLPGIASGAVMVIVSLATQKKDPARPLVATDGKIIKFAELAEKS